MDEQTRGTFWSQVQFFPPITALGENLSTCPLVRVKVFLVDELILDPFAQTDKKTFWN